MHRVLDLLHLIVRMIKNRGDWTTDSQIKWLKHTFQQAWPRSSLVKVSELNSTYLRIRPNRCFRKFGTSNSKQGSFKRNYKYCRMLNGLGYCNVKSCPYRHKCQKCDADHPECKHA